MADLIRDLFKIASTIAVTGVVLYVGLWIVRWDTGASTMDMSYGYLREMLGISESLARIASVAVGLLSAFVLGKVLLKPSLLWYAGMALLVLSLPATVLHNHFASKQCFDKSGEALCSVWKTPNAQNVIIRDDASIPASNWQRLRSADRVDVVRYMASPNERVNELPRRIELKSCGDAFPFFMHGEAVVYYAAGLTGLELWDRAGTHPQTNAPLVPVTAAVVREYCQRLADQIATDSMRAEIVRPGSVTNLAESYSSIDKNTQPVPPTVTSVRKTQPKDPSVKEWNQGNSGEYQESFSRVRMW